MNTADKNFFINRNLKPRALLSRRVDRFAVLFTSSSWLLYCYTPEFLLFITNSHQISLNSISPYKSASGILLIIFYQIFFPILKLETVYALFAYFLTGIFAYIFHVYFVGFGIIDFSWFGFYYGGLGALTFMRRLQGKLLDSQKIISKNIHKFDIETIREFKTDWQQLFIRFMRTLFTAATILGVCMSILLAREQIDPSGKAIPAWEDWNTLMMAAKMAGLFLLMTLWYSLFFVAPVLDNTRTYQDLLLEKCLSKRDFENECVD